MYRTFFLIVMALILWSFPISTVWGQDSLTLALREARTVRNSDIAKSSEIARSVLERARELSIDSTELRALFLLGWNAQVDGDYTRSTKYFMTIIKRDHSSLGDEELGFVYGRLGKNYSETGDYQKAIPFLLTYDSIISNLNLNEVNLEPKLLLGELYEYMLNFEKAGAYFDEAHRIAKEKGNRFARIQALYYLLDFNIVKHKKTGYEEEMAEYLDLLKQQKPDGTVSFGHAAMLLMGMEPAEKKQFLSNRLQAVPDSSSLLLRYFYAVELIKTYKEEGEINKAIKLAQQSYEKAKAYDNITILLSLHIQLAELYERSGDLQKALFHQKAYSEIRDNLHTTQVAHYVDSLEVLHQTAGKEAQLAVQKDQIIQQKRQRRNLLIALFLVLWFGAFLVLFFWNRNRLTARLAAQENTLHLQKINQLEQEKKLLAMSSMIEGQEAERKRIAQDLHDGLGGLLSTVKAQLNLIQLQVNKLETMDVYQKANTLIDNASTELRRIAYNMMPSTLSRLGLKEAVDDLSESLMKNHGIEVDYQVFGLNGRLDETKEIMIYRILQELCNNVIKHANASHLLIQLNKTPDELFLIVEDNGRGINQNLIANATGVGMRSLDSRVRYLNGELDISSMEGLGTCVTIHIPLTSEKNAEQVEEEI